MPRTRKKENKIDNDYYFRQKERENNFHRDERIKNHYQYLVIVIIYLVVIVIAFLILTVIVRWIWINEWDKVTNLAFSVGGGALGFVIAYLKERGLGRPE